eukprot:CAMPEP_0172504586 /NCGR_PEP_ID=MMETSP1066-20121228/180167_1 /TAXON_ID=671091 /ORGANISM="Coscinodiscus wailesii, Strain CCMP2513" /LENGTH=32 /DNA_ID= /DNA_START= /DNA_END= /DNA_ORIENTATION=
MSEEIAWEPVQSHYQTARIIPKTQQQQLQEGD